jgi:hypothetical protein
MKDSSRFIWILLLTSAAAAGCSDVGTDDEGASSDAITADGVVVLDAKSTDGADVADDRVTLHTLGDGLRERLAKGRIVVGRRGRGGKNAHGFLRKVRSVTEKDGSVVLLTESATLADAIRQGDAALVTDPLDPYGETKTDGTASIRPQALPSSAESERMRFTHTFDPRTIFTAPNFEARLEPTTTSCTPKFDTALKLRAGKLDELRFVMDDVMTVEASVSATLQGELTQNVQFPLFKNKIPLPPLGIGPIPIEETVDVSVDLACDFSADGTVKALAGVKVDLPFRFGVEYTKGDWHMVAESKGATIAPIGPTIDGSASAKIDCRLVPRLALLFYDVVGPYVAVTPRVVASVKGSFHTAGNDGAASGSWDLTGSIRADAGLTGEITIPGAPKISNLVNNGIQKAQFNLFSAEKTFHGDTDSLKKEEGS